VCVNKIKKKNVNLLKTQGQESSWEELGGALYMACLAQSVSSEFAAENFQEKYGGSEWQKKGFVWHQL